MPENLRKKGKKMTVRGTMVCYTMCNSWCYCLGSQHQHQHQHRHQHQFICSSANLLSISISISIYKEKLMMILHLKDLEEQSLAAQIYREQVDKGWPGLAKETKEICKELNIEDVNDTVMSKSEFKSLIKGAIQTKHEEMLKEESKGKTKCHNILKEGYGKKEYLNVKKIEDVRIMFKSRVGLMPFAGNYSHDKRFVKTNWLCRCGLKETEAHLTAGTCPIYDDIWQGRGDLRKDEDLVKFFSLVLERRNLLNRLEEEEREAPSPGSGDSFYC